MCYLVELFGCATGLCYLTVLRGSMTCVFVTQIHMSLFFWLFYHLVKLLPGSATWLRYIPIVSGCATLIVILSCASWLCYLAVVLGCFAPGWATLLCHLLPGSVVGSSAWSGYWLYFLVVSNHWSGSSLIRFLRCHFMTMTCRLLLHEYTIIL